MKGAGIGKVRPLDRFGEARTNDRKRAWRRVEDLLERVIPAESKVRSVKKHGYYVLNSAHFPQALKTFRRIAGPAKAGGDAVKDRPVDVQLSQQRNRSIAHNVQTHARFVPGIGICLSNSPGSACYRIYEPV